MPKVTIGELKKYLAAYDGDDTDIMYGVFTGLPGKPDNALANFITTQLQPQLGKLRMGVFACKSLPKTVEEAENLVKNAFFFSTL